MNATVLPCLSIQCHPSLWVPAQEQQASAPGEVQGRPRHGGLLTPDVGTDHLVRILRTYPAVVLGCISGSCVMAALANSSQGLPRRLLLSLDIFYTHVSSCFI